MQFNSEGRISEIDGLRAAAILGVLVWHYGAIPFPQMPGFVWGGLALGRSGVDLFFVLSGFLIGGILLDNRSATNYFSVFYLRRALRIWPSYFAIFLLWLLVRHLALPGTRSEIPGWQYALLIQNFGMAQAKSYGSTYLAVTWSLAVEEQFYLIFPFAVAVLSTRSIIKILLGALIFSPLFRIITFRAFGDDWLAYTSLPGRADTLACGVLLAMMVRDARLWEAIVRARHFVVYSLFCLIPGFVIFGWLGPGSVEWTEIGYSFFALVYALTLAIALIYRDSRKTRGLRSSPALFISKISYTTYLAHSPALAIASFWLSASTDRWAAVAAAVSLGAVLTVGYATVFYRLIELPAIRLGHRYRYASDSESSESRNC